MKTTPKDVFLYLLSIVTLIISVVSFLILTFQYINILIPDALNQGLYGVESRARGAMAALVVAWPIYILMMHLINKDIRQSADFLKLGIRKWLIYLTLFIAAITIIIDLITLLTNFLNGDLTMHFFLKTLLVLLVAAGVFGYYIWDIRRGNNEKHPLPRTMGWTLSALVLAIFTAGFFILGTPAEQRARRLDQQRVSDLQNIQYQVQNYYQQHNSLPESLPELEDTAGSLPQDPKTSESYTYNKGTEDKFSLCAVFETDSVNPNMSYFEPMPRLEKGAIIKGNNWEHGSGEVCFERTIVTQE